MQNSEEMNAFLSQIDSIQRRFVESLITGQRDPISREPQNRLASRRQSGTNQKSDDTALNATAE
jgi:hypothetical protein